MSRSFEIIYLKLCSLLCALDRNAEHIKSVVLFIKICFMFVSFIIFLVESTRAIMIHDRNEAISIKSFILQVLYGLP